jgi:hypothetical protein
MQAKDESTNQWQNVYVDRERHFALVIEKASGRTFLAIPVANSMVTYDEYYRLDQETFERFVADPSSALPMVQQVRRRELDHLLLLKPGTERGEPL